MIKARTVKRHPFDLYVAFLVFLMGAYGLIDSHWPPIYVEPWVAIVLIVEDIYLVAAGGVIMLATLLRRKHPIYSFASEMFGWLFVAFAATVITLTSFQIPPAVFVDPHPEDGLHLIHYSWIAIWAGLAIASFVRYLDMRSFMKNSCGGQTR